MQNGTLKKMALRNQGQRCEKIAQMRRYIVCEKLEGSCYTTSGVQELLHKKWRSTEEEEAI